MKATLAHIASIATILFLAGCNKGSSTLSSAVMTGDIASVKRHIAAGADVNMPVDMPPLYVATMFAADLRKDPRPDMRATEKNYKEIVELLIAKGADLDARERSGDTALGRASQNGHLEIVQLLISKGADVNVLLNSNQTKTALDAALSGGEAEIADFIRKHGGKTRAELEAEKQQ